MNRIVLFSLGVGTLLVIKLIFFSSDVEVEKVESINRLSMEKDEPKHEKEHSKKSVEIRYEKPSKSLNLQTNDDLRDENIYVQEKSYDNRVDREILDIEQDSTEVEKNVRDENQMGIDRGYVESNINSGELEPLFKEWKKKKDGVKYNIFVKLPNRSSESTRYAPPSIPNIVKVNVGGEEVPVVLPANSEAILAVEENGNVNYEPIDVKNNFLAPPSIGE